MSEESTRELPNRVSFEQRVFARFDSMDSRFDGIDARLEKLESRSYDTKPIWEKALAAIMETGLEVGELKKKVDAIETKVDAIETKVDAIETKVEGIETKVEAIETKAAQLVEAQRDFKVKITGRLDLVLETLVDTRAGMRDADERLTRLESKPA